MCRGNGPIAVMNAILVTLLAIGMLAVAYGLWHDSAVVIGFVASSGAGLQVASSTLVEEITVGFAAAGAVLLLVELWPGRRDEHFVSQIDGGAIEYSASLVAALIEGDLAGVDGVHSVRVSVSGRRQQVNVIATLAAEADVDPQAVASRALGRARDRVNGLGLGLGRLQISLEPTKLNAASPARPTRSVA